MPCFHPLKAAFLLDRKTGLPRINPSTGKRIISFALPKEHRDVYQSLNLNCGQCVGCRLERSRQWAIRCMHEAQMHEQNCFITLTFSPEALSTRDNPYSVDVRDFQLFMKKLRKKYKQKIRFYHCGEYGELNGRPHYHACLFGFDFPDKTLWKISNGNRLYISPSLSKLWGNGFCTIGDVTFESAAYVARYIMKKINGDKADEHYGFNPETGELIRPEYTTMSRRPGLGSSWLKQYETDVFPHDEVVVRGVKMRPPKYYDNMLALTRPYEFDEIKEKRLTAFEKFVDNNTPERLTVRETVTKARLNLLPRSV